MKGVFMEINKSFSDNKMPVYMQVYKKVMSEIYGGKWKPGDRLPNDMEFAKELGLNHLTLKKALNRLASEGYLTRTRGRGTFVSPILPKENVQILGKRVSVLYDVLNEHSFQSDIFLGIYREIEKLGLSLELLSANNSRTNQFKQIMDLFSDPDSAGCIVWPLMDMRQLENLAAAKPGNYPLVFINHKPAMDIRGIDFSGYDDFGAGQLMGEYISGLGFEKCIICQPSSTSKLATNFYRVAGLKQTLQCPAILFTDYEFAEFEKLAALYEQYKNDSRTAFVFISDKDSPSFKKIADKEHVFAFFTGVQPFCHGVQLSAKQMGENAIKVLQMRRDGDDSFSITRRIAGKIV